ncbi:MAG: protein-L-isoaspartate(D-aspartate) O-methyltransferase [Candidatus Hodarchaeales archaeon]
MSSLQEDKNRLIQNYIARGLVKDELAFKAFKEVPREKFLPANYHSSAYSDHPLPLMNTGQTISAPHMTIMILEYLELIPGLKVLEVGAGSGYQAALIAAAITSVKKVGHVYSLEIVPELVDFAQKNIEITGFNDRVTIISGDGTLGYEAASPYDRIILTAAGPELPPPLFEQLQVGGILVMPVGMPRMWQVMTKFQKTSESDFSREVLSSVAFVPLRGQYGT